MLLENKDKAIISKKLVTLKKNVPVEKKITEFELKNIDKEKLYNFLREMEFNRLLSSVISTYGDVSFLKEKDSSVKNKNYSKINKKNYELIEEEDDLNSQIGRAHV